MTFKPTYQIAVLTQRIAGGDITAVEELWPLMFEDPFDPTRPFDDIASDIAKKFEAYNESVAKAAEASKPANEVDSVLRLITKMAENLEESITLARSKRK